LQAAKVGGHTIVRAIDELPVLAVAATQAEGETVIRDAAELRVKETDRIATTVEELRKLGADIDARRDGFVVRGPGRLQGAVVSSHGDHRLAMALAVAGLIAQGETLILDTNCIADSFPGFEATLASLGADLA
jgi:3-phosphoshikimate 1-carboxyvinyltransferase